MIVVTGATGMLGGHLIRRLLLDNPSVIALKRSNSDVENLRSIFRFYGDNADELLRRIDWRTGDVEDAASLLQAMKNATRVYHCAAMVDLGKNTDKMLDVNVTGTRNVVNAALETGVKKLCFVSSIAALPNGNGEAPIDESTPYQAREPFSTYGKSKRMAENEIQLGVKKGLSAVIVNPGVILGYSKNMTGSGELFKRVKSGLPFYTNGMTGYIAVHDVVQAMILLMGSEISDEKFVLVGENCSNKDVLCWIADGYKKHRPVIGMGKSLIYTASLLEALGNIFRFKPVIDSASARTAVSRKSYSSRKLLSAFPEFQFSSIQDTIYQICSF